MTLLYRILMKPRAKREYQIPLGLTPTSIFDIGANIGASALLFASEFPQARVYCFEPVAQNFEILKKNAAPYPHLKVFNFGLGTQEGKQTLFYSDDSTNHGGFSQYEAGSDPSRKIEIEIRNPKSVIESMKIGPVDIIKVDTEGAEYEILTSLPAEWLGKTSLILGELHGNRDFELLHYLETWFQVGVNRPVSSRLGHFVACRKTA